MPWPTSIRFQQTIADSHAVTARAQLLVDEHVEVEFSTEGMLLDATVQCQHADEEQRTGTATLVDAAGDFIPTSVDDLLTPVGNELQLWRGALWNDGISHQVPLEQQGQKLLDAFGAQRGELAPIGRFRFVATKARYPTIDLQLHDRAWVIAGAKLERPLQIAAGTNYVEAVTRVLEDAWGAGLPTNFPSTDETTPKMVFEADSNRWEIAKELAANIERRLFFDPVGVATMIVEPDPDADQPTWLFDDADVRNLALPGLQSDWDVTDAINGVIVVGETDDADRVPRGAAFDLVVGSPTYYGGKFGQRPIFLRDEKITSDGQARFRAVVELRRRLGVPQSVTIPSLVNPAFEVGDVAWVRSPVRGLDQAVVFDRFSVPLRASEGMTIECRSRLVRT
jgi:hypothetical protein